MVDKRRDELSNTIFICIEIKKKKRTYDNKNINIRLIFIDQKNLILRAFNSVVLSIFFFILEQIYIRPDKRQYI